METKSEVLEVPMRRIQKSIGALLQGFVLSKGAKDQREHFMPGRIFLSGIVKYGTRMVTFGFLPKVFL